MLELLSTDLVARAVLVDMEPKVIKKSMSRAAKSGRWRYGEASHFSQKQGSGNNWANGWERHTLFLLLLYYRQICESWLKTGSPVRLFNWIELLIVF